MHSQAAGTTKLNPTPGCSPRLMSRRQAWFPEVDAEVMRDAQADWTRRSLARVVCEQNPRIDFGSTFSYIDLSVRARDARIFCEGEPDEARCLARKLSEIEGLCDAIGCGEQLSGSDRIGAQSCEESRGMFECIDSIRYMTDTAYIVRVDVRTACPSVVGQGTQCTMMSAMVWTMPVE